jgi:hypothetical protein
MSENFYEPKKSSLESLISKGYIVRGTGDHIGKLTVDTVAVFDKSGRQIFGGVVDATHSYESMLKNLDDRLL